MKLTNFWWKALIRFCVGKDERKSMSIACIEVYPRKQQHFQIIFSLSCVWFPLKKFFLSLSLVCEEIFSQFLLLSSFFSRIFTSKHGLRKKMFRVISILLTSSVCILSFEYFFLKILIKFIRRWVMMQCVASALLIFWEKNEEILNNYHKHIRNNPSNQRFITQTRLTWN